MKYVFLLAAVAVIYFVLIRNAPVAPVLAAITQKEAMPLSTDARPGPSAPSNVLKRPIDRTHAVLEQVKQRNGTGEF
jgi:hypothetical protein